MKGNRWISGLALWAMGSFVLAKEWTSTDGKVIEADVVTATAASVTLKMENGKIFNVPMDRLAKESQDEVRKWIAENTGDKKKKEGAKGETKRDFVDNFDADWPDTISADTTMEVEVAKEDAEKKEFIYHSVHYEFVCDSKLNTSVVRKFARLFEATYDYCRALPISSQRAHLSLEDKRHRIELFADRADYIKNGGPPSSAGVFMGGKNIIMVPLESLGVIASGSSYRVDYDKGNKTLPHEITHQLTDECYYSEGARGWFTEGLAEYVGTTPYTSGGTFKVRTNRDSLVEYVTAYGSDRSGGRAIGKDIAMAKPLRYWMMMPYDEFLSEPQRNYGMGALVTYYFFHMDGDGDRKAITDFMKALQAGKKGEEALEVLRMGPLLE